MEDIMRSHLLCFVLGLAFINLSVGCQSTPQSSPQPVQGSVSEESAGAKLKMLEEFAKAWNRHDLDALMSMMTDDCVFEASGGDDVNGESYQGQESVRAAFAAVFERFPDAHWGGARHFVNDDRGVSEWTFTGTLQDGRRVEVNGCDLFTFRDGKIAIKNSFRKNRPPMEK